MQISTAVSAAARRAGSPAAGRPGLKAFAMKESYVAKFVLAPVYRRFERASIRRAAARMILSLEGREMYSVTLRRLFSEIHRIQIGDYSLVRFDHLRLKAGTSVGKYSTIHSSVEFNNADHPRNTLSTHGVFYHRAYGFSADSNFRDNAFRLETMFGLDPMPGYCIPRPELGTGR
ncbi:MAG: hypothetical protein IPK15_20775 [Verrucomicrobia bacterium]|nr:hypothetical protein [Verrucomicrobiota bacterium]